MSDPFTPGLLARLPELPRKVVLLRASRIGDFVCATPAFRAVRAALPAAAITLITLPMLRDLAARLACFDRIVEFPGYPGLAEQFFEARRAVGFVQQMQAERFDLAIQMQGSGVYANPFTLLLGARVTAGCVREGDPAGRLDAALPFPQQGHEVQRVLALTSFLGMPAQGAQTEFPVWPEDRAAAAVLLASAEPPFIGLHPAARDLTRRWALDRFAAVGTALWRRHGRGTVVVLGEPEERATAETVARAIDAPCLNLAGRTSLCTLGGVLERLAVLVTNDTGPAHIAYALGVPTITIFGAGDPTRYRPPQRGPYAALVHAVPCRPCGLATCPIGYPCLEQVTVEEVIAVAARVML